MEKVVVFSISEDTSEIRSLLSTLDVSVVKEFAQKRPQPHKVGFLGPGTLTAIEKELESLTFDGIVTNGLLKPSQHHYLEMRFQTECIDRTGVILRIFAEHAHTPEAIAQVTLAKLRYELPFLREWIHKAKRGDRPGFLAGGAYATDVYYEHAKAHVRRIEQNLRDLSKQRETTRQKRHAKGYSLVSLSGYTNAGKSALFNRLCKAAVEVDDRLFSTLSTTTRKVLGVSGNVLMVDTVGFIKNLPPNLVDAFNSTLEEIFHADLILLVFDGSESIEMVRTKLKTCLDILLPRVENQSLVIIANKIDMMNDASRKGLAAKVDDIVHSYPMILVSARTEEGLDDLRDQISTLEQPTSTIDVRLPMTDRSLSLLSRLRTICQVMQGIVKEEVRATVRCKEGDRQRILGLLSKAGGTEISFRADSASNHHGINERASKGSEGAPLTEED